MILLLPIPNIIKAQPTWRKKWWEKEASSEIILNYDLNSAYAARRDRLQKHVTFVPLIWKSCQVPALGVTLIRWLISHLPWLHLHPTHWQCLAMPSQEQPAAPPASTASSGPEDEWGEDDSVRELYFAACFPRCCDQGVKPCMGNLTVWEKKNLRFLGLQYKHQRG